MRRLILSLLLPALAQPLAAQQPATQRLGTVRFSVSCNAAVRPRFNEAVALLHSFGFPAAIKGFNDVLAMDKQCAMAQWGLALSAWGNPFAVGNKSPELLQRGLLAVTSARSLHHATKRERGYIDAVARLYENTQSLDQRARLIAYRDAMAAVVAMAPADTEAVIFHALAQVAAADPTDKSYASQLAAGATLERLFAVLPDHPGLAHYLIHTYDVPALASRGLHAAESYSKIAPSMSHALHMPSHIYTRVGEWKESIAANVAAAAAADREGSVAEELHATDYQIYAYLQSGQIHAARKLVDSLPAISQRLDPKAVTTGAPPAAGYYAIAAIPARFALERGEWAEAARLQPFGSPTPFAEAVSWFARGLGAARSGDTATARSALTNLDSIANLLGTRHEVYWGEQVAIQRLVTTAWLELAEGRTADALTSMQAAAEREDATEKNAISPGPLAPARELLGEMLMTQDHPAQALTAFETALQHEPNRMRSLQGAAAAAHATNDSAKAQRYASQLSALMVHEDNH